MDTLCNNLLYSSFDLCIDFGSLYVSLQHLVFVLLSLGFIYLSSLSVYKAVELCAFELYDDIDYDSWYQSQLLTELQIQDPR